MKRIFIAILLMLPISVYAQKLITVSGEYVYYPPDTESYEIAKSKALHRAQIQILADTFGTVINSGSTTIVANSANSSSVESFTLGESYVKGEWIETIGEPLFERFLGDNDILAIRVKLKGKVREISSAAIEYDAKILKNGMEDKFESTDFKNGDELYFSFKAPVNGYLAIYLYDGNETVYCLLPYLAMEQGAYEINGGEKYVLFSVDKAKSPLKPYQVDEFTLTCERRMELNRIYCIFSPNAFVKATDNRAESETLPREVSYEDFGKWLSKIRTFDTEMKVKTFDITIQEQ